MTTLATLLVHTEPNVLPTVRTASQDGILELTIARADETSIAVLTIHHGLSAEDVAGFKVFVQGNPETPTAVRFRIDTATAEEMTTSRPLAS